MLCLKKDVQLCKNPLLDFGEHQARIVVRWFKNESRCLQMEYMKCLLIEIVYRFMAWFHLSS